MVKWMKPRNVDSKFHVVKWTKPKNVASKLHVVQWIEPRKVETKFHVTYIVMKNHKPTIGTCADIFQMNNGSLHTSEPNHELD